MAQSGRLILPDPEAVSQEAAKRFAAASKKAIQERGRFLAVLSGGRTSKRTYELLATPPYQNQIPWEQTHLFMSDERFVPEEDPEYNFGIVREKLVLKLPIPEKNLHPFIVQASSLEEAAEKSEKAFRKFFGKATDVPRFDFVFLGMGRDGHAAGLFPGKETLEVKDRLVAFSEKTGGFDRLTFTLPLLNAAREVVFLVTGEEKAEMVGRILKEKKETLPAVLIRPTDGTLLWLLDRSAASQIHH